MERLQGNIQSESDFTDQPSPTIQLAVLVKLYSLCELSHILESYYVSLTECVALPRLNSRRRTPEDTLGPVLSDLQSALRVCASEATPEDALVLVRNVFEMIRSVLLWIQGMDVCSSDVIAACTVRLKVYLKSP